MKAAKLSTIVVILVLLQSCRFEPSWKNVEDIEKLEIGMSEAEVRREMRLEPIKVMEDDSLYIYGRKLKEVKKLIYDTPYMSSSKICLSFAKEDSLIDIFSDF